MTREAAPLQRNLVAPPPGGLRLQRKCACGAHTLAGGECGTCGKEGLQRKASNPSGPSQTPAVVHEVLRSAGEPLDAGMRALMGSRLDHDFSGVRVHTDAKAAESAERIGALAYTVGRDVVFARGRFAPGTDEGRRLLAHELAHVAQQSGAGAATAGELRIGEAGGPSECAADDAASRVAGGAESGVAAASARPSAPVLQRQPAPGGAASPGRLQLSPMFASALGSTTVDGFELGKSDLTEDHKKKLAAQAVTILRLLGQFPDSFISVVGHTDAVDAAEKNTILGQKRAEAVLAELSAGGVPASIMRASSLGESSLAVQTGAAEPLNRRVEVFFSARTFFQPPLVTPSPGWQTPPPVLTPRPNFNLPPNYDVGPIGPGRPQPSPDIWKPIPPAPRRSDPLEDALDRDPLLRTLPKFMRGPIKDALKRGDEKMMETAVDSMDAGGLNKGALKAALKALLRTLRDEKWQPPTPPLHEIPPSPGGQFPKMPGEKLFDIWKYNF